MTAALARLAADPAELHRDPLTDPAVYLIAACTQAKGWLALALGTNDIEQIAELKSQAEALRAYSASKQLGKDAELAAQEVVRRAERGIGVAIRLGQESGEIETPQEARSRAARSRAGGGAHQIDDVDLMSKPKPTDYADKDELSNGIYQVTDGVPDDVFEEVITEALAEKNLARANVARKAKAKAEVAAEPTRVETIIAMAEEGHNSRQIGKALGLSADRVRELARGYDVTIQADELAGRTRRIDSARVVQQTVLDVAASTSGLDLVDFSALGSAELPDWNASLTDSLRTLRKFADRLKKEMATRGEAG